MGKPVGLLIAVLGASTLCTARTTGTIGPCRPPKPIISPAPGYKPADIKKQPHHTADLPSVIQTVVLALECYRLLSGAKDPMQPAGLPRLSSAVMGFKTASGETVGFTFSIFVFKVGASREKDVTDGPELYL
jgi:hypothetical protein